MELIRRFPDLVVASALESWDFLDLADKSPLFTSPFGDVFMQGPKSYWLLDVVGGSLRELCATGEELTAILNTKDGRDEYLMVGLAAEAEANGLVPSGDEIYDFRIPPVLGGSLAVPNLQLIDFEVAVNLAGQIHEQVRNLPPGTPVRLG